MAHLFLASPILLLLVQVHGSLDDPRQDTTQQNTPEQLKQAFQDAFNGDQAEKQASLVRDFFSGADDAKVQRIASVVSTLRTDWGPMRVAEHHDVKDGSRRIAVHLVAYFEEKGDWKSFQFFCAKDNPSRFTSFAVVDAIEPKNLPAGTIQDKEVQHWLDEHIRWLSETRQLSGTFAVLRRGEVIYEKSCGWANAEKRSPVTSSTPFNLASGTKMLTAICIGQLVEQGKLSFDDKVVDVLPDSQRWQLAKNITVRQLLTHTSGLPEYWTDEFETAWDKVSTLDDFTPYFAKSEMQFEPGSQHQYCNTNFIVLGMIVESKTGQPFWDYMRENVFSAIQMNGSGFWQEQLEVNDRLAVPYELVLNEQGRQEWISARLTKNGSSAGGSFSSMDDMYKFDRALTQHKLLSKAMTENLTAGKVAQPVGGKYGFGFMESNYNGKRVFGHGGTAPGTYFDYLHFPDSGHSIVYFCNHDATSANDVFRKFIELISRD